VIAETDVVSDISLSIIAIFVRVDAIGVLVIFVPLAEGMGVVPLGIPLIVGPAILTTSMVIISHYGLLWMSHRKS